jgi:hypothetical protein
MKLNIGTTGYSYKEWKGPRSVRPTDSDRESTRKVG